MRNEGGSSALDFSISKAVDFLYRSQLLNGEFGNYLSYTDDLRDCSYDSTCFVAASVLYCTRFVNFPRVMEIKRKAVSFLVEEMQDPGVWTYWTARSHKRIDPDLDDTAMISFVLKDHHPLIHSGSNIGLLLDNRDTRGLFCTWLRPPRTKNDIDSVVNANVLLYLGERDETKAASQFLNDIIARGQESGSYWYYTDDLSLYYAISRAFANGVSSLEAARNLIVSRLSAAQRQDGSFGNDLATAYAACTLLNFGYEGPLLSRAVNHMLQRQLANGAWSKAPAFTGPEPPGPRSVWWGSEGLTTAISVEALARYRVENANL